MRHRNVEIIMPAVKETDSGAYILSTKHKKITGVQELVRCKDCRKSQYDAFFEQWWCQGRMKSADGFCNLGERREDE